MALSPLLTIITPVYNGADFIEETVRSVLNVKTKITFEYLVINDGSTDNTSKILQKFADKIAVFNQSNMGEANTVNKGIDMANGKYVLILNADDPLLTSSLLDESVEILQKDEAIAAVYPDWNVIDRFGTVLSTNVLPDYSDQIMIGKCKTLPGPGTIFRTSMAKKIQGRNSNWRFVSDYDFWLRLSRVGRIVRIPKVLAQWRYHDTSASIANRGLEMAYERIKVIELFIFNNEIELNMARNAIGNAYYMAARLAFFDKRINGRTLFFNAMLKNRGFPSESRFFVILYLLFLPFSRKIVKFIPYSIIKSLGT
jgi:glycosyltransferase involved in cell wall biosynthesis